MAARFTCRLSAEAVPLPHVWEHTVGSDHAPMALRADWQAQLRRSHDELGFRYVRFHGLLSDDMSTLVRRQGNSLYSFFNADRIVDFLLSIGMKPFVELSFMPRALASGDRTVFHYRGNVTPPEDYDQWSALIHRLASHVVERYGIEEVRQWFFEVWNEPNLGMFWTGGPATAANAWVSDFLEFCGANGVAVDFISTHHYPTDGFGQAGEGTEAQLSQSHRGVLREQAQATRRQAGGRPVFYTEWNTSADPRDPLHDEPYAAAFVTKTVMEASPLVQGYGFWTFSDIFEEEGFPTAPFHGGFGLLNVYGIAKPSYRAFELLHRLGTEQWRVTGTHATVDVWVVRSAPGVTVLLSNHALPRHAIEAEPVHIALEDAPAPGAASVQRIDASHCNAKRLWRDLGEPDYPDTAALARLHDVSCLRREPQSWRYAHAAIALDVVLPPHAVAAVELRFA